MEDGKQKIMKEIYIGNIERLAGILGNLGMDMKASAIDFSISFMSLPIDGDINLWKVINETVKYHKNGLSPEDYILIFIMNRLSDPSSKNLIHEWMQNDMVNKGHNKKHRYDLK